MLDNFVSGRLFYGRSDNRSRRYASAIRTIIDSPANSVALSRAVRRIRCAAKCSLRYFSPSYCPRDLSPLHSFIVDGLTPSKRGVPLRNFWPSTSEWPLRRTFLYSGDRGAFEVNEFVIAADKFKWASYIISRNGKIGFGAKK